MIRPILLAAAAATLGATVKAETGTVQVGPDFHSAPYADPSAHNTYCVHLTQGDDYALEVSGYPDATWNVLNASGKSLALSLGCGGFDLLRVCGLTFRATYTGDYFVDMRGMDLPAGYFPGSPSFTVDKDCKADRKTRCTLPVGATRSGRLLNYLYDDDWYRMPLKGGVSYRVTAAPEAGTGYSPKPMIQVLSPVGDELAKGMLGNATQDVQFTVTTTGSYFLLVYDDFTAGSNPHGQQARYTVSLARR